MGARFVPEMEGVSVNSSKNRSAGCNREDHRYRQQQEHQRVEVYVESAAPFRSRAAQPTMPPIPRNRLPLLALFAGNAVSMVGNVLATVAIPWFVLQTTGSAARTGLVGFFTILPVVLAGLLAEP